MTPEDTARHADDLTIAAARVCVSVTPAIRRRLSTRGESYRRVLVDPAALASLVDAVEAIAPGMLARVDADIAERRSSRHHPRG